MTVSRFQLVLSGAVILVLTACGGQPVNMSDLETKSHFWQRVDASSALYLQGPKAQQILNRDLSRCVTELRELEHLGAIRVATPGDMKNGKVPDPTTPEGELAQWETPARDGMLRAEHLDYHDFRTCMMSKGWERVENVPYEVADRAREVYTETVLGQRYRTKTRQRDDSPVSKPDSDFDHLN